VRIIMESTSLEGVLGDLAAMKDRPDSTPDLAHIAVPTLIVHGADDQIIPVDDARTMHAAIPGSRLEVIPDAGHLPCLENPIAFNSAVRQFLADVRR
jgi:3-oxoadipate enol-lactonase